MHGNEGSELLSTTPHQYHAVQFYATEEFLCDTVASFLGEGLLRRQPALLVARAERRAPVLSRLHAHNGDDGEPIGDRVWFWDAREALATFMDGERPDPRRFRNSVGAMIDRCLERTGPDGGRGARAYGEMVDVLWRDGLPEAAVAVEELWNELAESHAFDLLCAYAMGNFYQESHREPFDRVCRAHTHVMPVESFGPDVLNGAHGREIALLQQRAQILETEIEHRRQLETALRSALAARRSAEEAERRAREDAERANQAKSEFLAVMSHELRTPLNAIIGYHDLLQRDIVGPLNGEQRAFLHRIGQSANQLVVLIDQVLSLSRIEAGRDEVVVETFDAAGLARNTCTMVQPAADQKGLSIEVRAPDAPVLCSSDPGKVRQILLNLLSNAVKFTRDGGVTVTVRPAEGAVDFEVSDTGIGIDRADAARIFDRFVQLDSSLRREQGGSGLGLAVSRKLAVLLGGDIRLESAPGVGSCFTLHLPSAASQASR